MKAKNKQLLRVGILTENELVERLLTEALTYSKDIEINSIRIKSSSDFHDSSNMDILIICDHTIENNKWILKSLSRRQESFVQVYVATYKMRITAIEEYLHSINGCILLDGNLMLLPNIIRMGRNGYTVMPATTFINFGREHDLINALSLYECALLHELAIGKNERTITTNMGTTRTKLAFHLRNIYRKINVSTSVDAVSFAKRHKDHLHKTRRKLIRAEGLLLSK